MSRTFCSASRHTGHSCRAITHNRTVGGTWPHSGTVAAQWHSGTVAQWHSAVFSRRGVVPTPSITSLYKYNTLIRKYTVYCTLYCHVPAATLGISVPSFSRIVGVADVHTIKAMRVRSKDIGEPTEQLRSPHSCLRSLNSHFLVCVINVMFVLFYRDARGGNRHRGRIFSAA
jgi:hypothetical protein